MYFLVLLRLADDASAEVPEHEPFIDSLIERHGVLLGGEFLSEPAPGVIGGYLLRCADLAEAEQVVAGDPLVTSGACTTTISGWNLVGIDPAAIDPEMTV